jgi:hypothetical protein
METLLSFLPYFFVGYCSFKLGKHWALWQFSQNMAQRPDEIIKVLERIKEMDEPTTELTIERVGDQLFAYAKDTGQFLAQAPNLNNLLEIVHTRFPGKKFFGTISADDPAKDLVK